MTSGYDIYRKKTALPVDTMPQGPRTCQRSANRSTQSAPCRSSRASTQAATTASVNFQPPPPPRASAASNTEPEIVSPPSDNFSEQLEIIRTQVREELEVHSRTHKGQQLPMANPNPTPPLPAQTSSTQARPKLPVCKHGPNFLYASTAQHTRYIKEYIK